MRKRKKKKPTSNEEGVAERSECCAKSSIPNSCSSQRLDLMEGPQIAQSFSEDLKRALIGSIFSRILEVARFFYGEALYFVLARSIHAAIAVFLWFLMQ